MPGEPPCHVFKAEMPSGLYLGRGQKVNPTVFLQWGQEIAEVLRLNDFSNYGEFEVSESKTIFMRNLRLTLTAELHAWDWSKPYKITYEAFSSHAGRTSFDMTIRFFVDGTEMAVLIRKMVYVSIKTGKPIDLPPKFVATNPLKSNLKFDLQTTAPRNCSEVAVVVRPSDIDFNDHVGHPVYVDYMLDSAYYSKYKYIDSPDLLTKHQIRYLDLEYKYPIALGKKVTVQSWDVLQDTGNVMMNFVMYQAGFMSKYVVCLGKMELFK